MIDSSMNDILSNVWEDIHWYFFFRLAALWLNNWRWVTQTTCHLGTVFFVYTKQRSTLTIQDTRHVIIATRIYTTLYKIDFVSRNKDNVIKFKRLCIHIASGKRIFKQNICHEIYTRLQFAFLVCLWCHFNELMSCTYSLLWHYCDVIMRGLKSPVSPLFHQPFVRAQIKQNIRAPRRRPLLGELTDDQWFPHTKASNAENVSICWRHHDIIQTFYLEYLGNYIATYIGK